MALIKCPECGKEISDTSVTCPNCGFRLKLMSQKTKDLISIIVIIALIMGTAGFCISNKIKHDKEQEIETQQLKNSYDKLQKDLKNNDINGLEEDIGDGN